MSDDILQQEFIGSQDELFAFLEKQRIAAKSRIDEISRKNKIAAEVQRQTAATVLQSLGLDAAQIKALTGISILD